VDNAILSAEESQESQAKAPAASNEEVNPETQGAASSSFETAASIG